MTIQIPKDISDPNLQEICRQVFTEIVGGEAVGFGYIPMEGEEFKTHRYTLLLNKKNHDGFNPFLNSQDTKLCDPWLVGNKLRMYTDFEPVTNSWEVIVRPWDWNFTPGIRLELGHATGYTEEMARMVAIIKAFNKLEEK